MYRIFLVEDDETIARLIKKHLEKWEYEVSTVQDFGNVLGEFAVCDPQLVLLDIRLPFTTAITGVHRSGRCQRFRSSFCHPYRTI